MFAQVGERTVLTSLCTVPAHSLLVCWLHAAVIASHAVQPVQCLGSVTACTTSKTSCETYRKACTVQSFYLRRTVAHNTGTS
jgi:hypothetical protein